MPTVGRRWCPVALAMRGLGNQLYWRCSNVPVPDLKIDIVGGHGSAGIARGVDCVTDAAMPKTSASDFTSGNT
jgi:hypothetical protein